MIRLICLILGLATLTVLVIAVKADPHLWAQAVHVLDHRARGAGTDLNAHLNGWITPSGQAAP